MLLSQFGSPATKASIERPDRSTNQRRITILVVTAVLAFAVKLILMLTTWGTNDVLFWQANLHKIQSDGGSALYRDGAIPEWQGKKYRVEPFNQPPFMVHVIRLWGVAAEHSAIPFRNWLRGTSALADIVMLAIVWALKSREWPLSSFLLVALSPVSILISGFHGNTDALMIMFVVLSIYLLESGRPVWLAGLALGMAMNIKVVPIILIPAFVLHIRRLRLQVEFLVAVAMVFIGASMPYLESHPVLIIHRVFGYNSASHVWGFSILTALAPQKLMDLYSLVGKPIALFTVFAATLWLRLKDRNASLFDQCGFLVCLFLVLTPGFGVQYLAWLVPWYGLSWRAVGWHCFISTAVLAFRYAPWMTTGWHLANVLEQPTFPSIASLWAVLGLLSWASLFIVLRDSYRLMTAEHAATIAA